MGIFDGGTSTTGGDGQNVPEVQTEAVPVSPPVPEPEPVIEDPNRALTDEDVRRLEHPTEFEPPLLPSWEESGADQSAA